MTVIPGSDESWEMLLMTSSKGVSKERDWTADVGLLVAKSTCLMIPARGADRKEKLRIKGTKGNFGSMDSLSI